MKRMCTLQLGQTTCVTVQQAHVRHMQQLMYQFNESLDFKTTVYTRWWHQHSIAYNAAGAKRVTWQHDLCCHYMNHATHRKTTNLVGLLHSSKDVVARLDLPKPDVF